MQIINIGSTHWRVRKIQQKHQQGTLVQVYPTRVKGIMLQEDNIIYTLCHAEAVVVDDSSGYRDIIGVDDWVENKITSKEEAVAEAEKVVTTSRANPRRKLPVTLEILDD